MGVVKLGRKIHARLFVRVSWGVPAATSLFFDYVTLQDTHSSFLTFIFKPNAGNLSVTTKLCQNLAEFV